VSFSGVLGAASGGTGSTRWAAYVPGSTVCTYSFPSSDATVLTTAALVTVAQGGTGTATPSLVAGANITITGSWPNQTIALTSPVASTFIVGDGAGSESIAIDGGAAAWRELYFRSAAKNRWSISVDNTAEGGSDAGSNFNLFRYHDAGPYIGVAFFVRRSDGQVGIGNTNPGKQLDVTGDVRSSAQLISTMATGTAPLAVSSTTEVTNLNADRVGGTELTNAATAGALLIGSGAGTAAWGTPDGARVYNDADETIPDSTATALTFNSERYDNGGLHSSVSNTSRLTAQKAGVYTIFGHVEWEGNAVGYRQLSIYWSGGYKIAQQTFVPGYGSSFNMSIASVWHLAAGEYVELWVFQTSGGDLRVWAALDMSPEFAMQWLGP
jgi:hypothetical protein